MPINDPVADMLTRIRNAIQARHQTVLVPQSKIKTAIADILKAQGYIRDWDLARNQKFPTMRLHLAYRDDNRNAIRGLKRISKPACGYTLAAARFHGCTAGWASPSSPPPRDDDRLRSLAQGNRRRVGLLCLVMKSSSAGCRPTGSPTERPLSRIGRQPIPIPDGVQVEVSYGGIIVTGPRGTVTQKYHPEVNVKVEDGAVIVEGSAHRAQVPPLPARPDPLADCQRHHRRNRPGTAGRWS